MCGQSYFPLSLETPRWVLVARILRARGNKGEVAAEILTDFPERLTRLREVFVGHAGGKSEPRCMALKSCWLSQNHRAQAVFHFEGVDSISEAEKFRELEVLLPFEQRVTLPAAHSYVSALTRRAALPIPRRPPPVPAAPGRSPRPAWRTALTPA